MANLNPNLTTSPGLSPTMQEYYDKKLLKDMKPKLVHAQFGQKRPIPSGNGKTIQFRKYTPFEANLTKLTEGQPGDGQTLVMTEKRATVSQYGNYVSISDFLDMTALDPVINDAIGLMADQGAVTVDNLIRDELTTGTDATNVQYATGSTRAAQTAAGKLTSVLLRKAVRTLKKAKAPMFGGNGKPHYVAIVGPDTVYDLQDDPDWKAVATYQDSEKIYDGEIGKLYSVRVVETTEAKIFKGAGAAGVDVAATLVLGRDAYGLVDIENGSAVKSIIKPRGSAGTADPLDQVSTVGWKVPAFTTRILMPNWMVRIEHGISV